jgi:hypothetical protein
MAMPPVDDSLGQQIDAWIDRLDEEGFHVGVRERLVVQTLLARLSTDGKLAELQSHEILNIVGPLICTKPEQQRQYSVLAEQFLAQPRRMTPQEQTVYRNDSSKINQWQLKWWQPVLIVVLLAACIAIAWRFWPKTDVVIPLPQETKEQSGTPTVTSFGPTGSGWMVSIHNALLGLSTLTGLVLSWILWARWRRQLYLQSIRTDEEINERFLQDPHPIVLEPAAGIVRGASRQLRQRYAGEHQTIDIPSTIYATMAAGGAFVPRYRALPQTPEYLVLIDQRHPADHHTTYSQALINALREAGVSVQIYYFEGSPQAGCWQVRRTSRGQDRIRTSSIPELAARFTGYRLLIFADAQALVEESDGTSRPWTKYLKLFPQRVWFTPMPLSSWGPSEQMIDEQGFLLLPVQEESLTTMGNWFSSGHLVLEMAEDWPLRYPPMLRGQEVAWVVRQTVLPAKDLEELLFQLRDYLGATRFQWLCACALFPTVSPPITLALGREVLGENARELALGVAAIGALPWFRHAFVPAWLRQALISCLNETNEARFREVIEERLADAVEDRVGASLLSVAKKKRLLAVWFRRRKGLARDVVLVDFLHSGSRSKLAQRLPEALRKRLFGGDFHFDGLTSRVLQRLKPITNKRRGKGGIYISYRREDSAGWTGRLAEHLKEQFGAQSIFMDVDAIEPGVDFREALQKAVSSCGVLLVMIGPEWATVTDQSGRLRIDDPSDWVRIEVATALKQNIRVIPVLVGGAMIPPQNQLPQDLGPLTHRHAYELTDRRWNYDVEQLIKTFATSLHKPSSSPNMQPSQSILVVVGAMLVVGILGMLVTSTLYSPDISPIVNPPRETSAKEEQSATPQLVHLRVGQEARLKDHRTTCVYKVLAAQLDRSRPDLFLLRMIVRVTNEGVLSTDFEDGNFRLLIDNVPRTPISNLNDLVDAHSAKEGTVVFAVPVSATRLELQIRMGEETATFPFNLPSPELGGDDPIRQLRR